MEWAVFGGRMENSQDATVDAECEDAVCVFVSSCDDTHSVNNTVFILSFDRKYSLSRAEKWHGMKRNFNWRSAESNIIKLQNIKVRVESGLNPKDLWKPVPCTSALSQMPLHYSLDVILHGLLSKSWLWGMNTLLNVKMTNGTTF